MDVSGIQTIVIVQNQTDRAIVESVSSGFGTVLTKNGREQFRAKRLVVSESSNERQYFWRLSSWSLAWLFRPASVDTGHMRSLALKKRILWLGAMSSLLDSHCLQPSIQGDGLTHDVCQHRFQSLQTRHSSSPIESTSGVSKKAETTPWRRHGPSKAVSVANSRTVAGGH